MKLRASHVVLFLLAVPPVLIGGLVLYRCVFDRSYDSTVWGCLIFAVPLLLIAAALIGFVVRDARRR